MLLKLNGIPKVCEALADQANCEKAVELCGADSDLTGCTVKIIGMCLISPDGNSKILPAWWGFGKDVYHFSMKHGHNVLHRFANDLVHNVSGNPGQIGAVGQFIAEVMGVQ